MNLTFKSQIVTDVPLSWLSRYGTDIIASRNFRPNNDQQRISVRKWLFEVLTLVFRVENG